MINPDNFTYLPMDMSPHTGPFVPMPIALVGVGGNVVREKRYISRNKYKRTKYPARKQ